MNKHEEARLQTDLRNLTRERPPVLHGEVRLTEESAECSDCFHSFIMTKMTVGGVVKAAMSICDPCLQKRNTQLAEELAGQDRARRISALAGTWKTMCPPAYQRTDLEQMKKEGKISQENISRVLGREFGPKGLALIGLSRKGKTRLMFLLLRRYHAIEGHQVAYVRAPDLADELAALYGQQNGALKANEYIKAFMRAPVFFLDDLGKEKLTERGESALWRIIEHRSSHDLPIFFTANSKGSKLVAKMTNDDGEVSDRAVPIVERLREFCDCIEV